MKPVELEILLRDNLSPGINKVGSMVDGLLSKARKANAGLKDMEEEVMVLRNVIAMYEAQLEHLRTISEAAPIDLDQSENIAQIKMLEEQIEGLKNELQQLQTLSAQTKVTPGDIPQAQGKFNGLHNSIQQMAREMPSLAMGPQTFFMAISNNLPIFTDEIARARNEYNALVAAGGKGVPVWKQILKSLFSWQTALTTGIMLLVMYGDEILDWVSSLFNGEKQLTAAERAQRGLNEAIKENGLGVGEDILLVRRLSDVWASLGDNMDKKKQFIVNNRDEFDKLGVSVSDVNDAESLLVENTPDFIEAMRLRAEAAAAQKLAAEQYEVALTKERELSNTPELVKSVQWEMQAGNGGQGRLSKKDVTVVNPEYVRLENESKEARENAEAYYDMAAAADLAAKAKLKAAGIKVGEGKGGDSEDNRLAAERRRGEELLRLKRENQQKEIDLKEEGREKRLAQIELDYQVAKDEIASQEEAWKEAQNGTLTQEQRDELKKAYALAQKEMETAVASVDDEELSKERDKLSALLDEYKTYDQQRKDIDEAYARDKSLMNAELQRLRESGASDEDIAAVEASLAARTDVYRSDIENLESEILESTDFYDKLFGEISIKGHKVLKDFYAQAQEVLANTKEEGGYVTIEVPVKTADGKYVKQAVTVTVAEFERMRDQLKAIREDLEKNNPFAAFKNAWSDLLKEIKGKGDVTGALSSLLVKGNELTDTIRGWGDSLGSIFGDRISQSVDEMMNMVDGVMGMGIGIAQLASGDIVGGITNTLSGLSQIVETIVSWKEKAREMEREDYLATIEVNRALRERSSELAAQRDTIHDICVQQETLNWLVENGYSKPSSVSKWEAMYSAFETYRKNLENEIRTNEDLWNRLQGSQAHWSWGNSLNGGEAWVSLSGLRAEQIALYYEQGKLTSEAAAYYEAWVASGKSVEELKANIEESYASLREMVMGTSFDGFLSNVMNAIRDSRGEISKLGKFTEETLSDALMNAFMYKHLANAIEPLYNELSEAFINGTADEDFIKEWKSRFTGEMSAAWDALEQTATELGIDLSSIGGSQSGKPGSFNAMSQEQGTKLEGLFVSGQMHWASIDEHMEDVSLNMSLAVGHLRKIEENTGSCSTTLDSILTAINKIKSDGLKMK